MSARIATVAASSITAAAAALSQLEPTGRRQRSGSGDGSIAARPEEVEPCSRGRVRDHGRRAACLVAVLGLAFAGVLVSGAGASGNRVVTVYSVATGLQYINTADDRARGRVNNPFDDATNKLAPKGSGGKNGPFAGDVAVYVVNLFSSSALKRRAGSGVYTCYFNYDQHALCKAYYKLTAGGTLVASGPIDFKNAGFSIVLTGGTSKYLGVRGEVKVAPAASKAQRIDFELIG
jgi:hypothetical protein